jgi:hypothetical protein
MLHLSPKGDNMTTESSPTEPEEQKIQVRYRSGSYDTVYGLGLIGAWVYYISRATTFRQGVLGFLKGIVWPAFLVYELLEFLDKQ